MISSVLLAKSQHDTTYKVGVICGQHTELGTYCHLFCSCGLSICYVFVPSQTAKNRQFPRPLLHISITAAANTTVQIVQGFLSRKKLITYSIMKMALFVHSATFGGLGIKSNGNSHCRQYILIRNIELKSLFVSLSEMNTSEVYFQRYAQGKKIQACIRPFRRLLTADLLPICVPPCVNHLLFPVQDIQTSFKKYMTKYQRNDKTKSYSNVLFSSVNFLPHSFPLQLRHGLKP